MVADVLGCQILMSVLMTLTAVVDCDLKVQSHCFVKFQIAMFALASEV